MPTISAQLDVSLQDGDLGVQLSAQTGQLGEAATLLASLIAEPPGTIDELAAALGAVGLPDIDVLGELGPAIASLQDALPDDLTATTTGLLEACLSIGVRVADELVPQVEKLVGGLHAMADLVERARNFGSVEAEASATASASGGGIGGEVTSGGTPAPTPAEARRDERAAAVTKVNAALDELPEPLDAPAVLTFVHDRLTAMSREVAAIPYIPVIDDLLYLLSTTIELKQSDASALEMHIRASIDRLAVFLADAGRAPVDALTAQLSVLPPHLGAAALETDVQTLVSRLEDLAAAVSGGDVGGTGPKVAEMNTALDSLLPALSTLRTELFSGQVDAAMDAFARLPSDMDAALRRVAHATTPPGFLRLVSGARTALDEAVDATGIEELVEGMGKAFEEVLQTLERLDVSSQLTSVQEVITELEESVASVEGLLSDAASQLSSAFQGLRDLIDEIDLAPVTQEVEDVLASFVDELRKKVDDLFAPVTSALSSAVDGVSDALGSFDPATIVDAVNDAIDSIASVLDDPAVAGAIGEIKATLDGVASALQSLSFKPVTDQVVSTIEEITTALQAIDPDLLSPAVKLALSGAVMLLPADLDPVTDPLKVEFSGLLEVGPKPLLEQVRNQPGLLLERVRLFSPEVLVGSQLSGPFDELIAQLEDFTPSALLSPVTDAVGGLKGQLEAAADPGALVEPLRAPFEAVKGAITSIDPAALVTPLQAAIDGAVEAVLAAIPLEDVLGALADFGAAAESVADTAAGIRALLGRLTGIVAGLADPEQQLRAWLQPVVDLVDQFSSLAQVQVSMDAAAAALDDLSAGALGPRVAAEVDPLSATLEGLAAGDLLQAVTSAHRSVPRPALAALAPSAEKDAIVAVLGRFDPLDPAFSGPFTGLAQWSSALTRDRAAWDEFLTLWARRSDESHPPLQGLRHAGLTKARLKEIVQAGFEDEIITPLSSLLGLVGDAAAAVQTPLAELDHFVEKVAETITAIASGPASLGALGETTTSLVDAIRAIDLQFLVEELQTIFTEVGTKLDAIGPDAVEGILEGAIHGALDALDPTQLLPTAEIEALDAEYSTFVDELKLLDPTALVIAATMPVFEEKILPLLAVFDLTAVIEALITVLETLEGELGVELERVNEAYKAMLDAVPQISLLDIDLDIDVDVEVDIGF